MATVDYKLLVLSNPMPGHEAAFERWYDVHVRELVNHAEPLLAAERFRRVDATAGQRPPYQHLVISDWRAHDLAGSWQRHLESFTAGVASGAFTPPPAAFDAASAQHWMFAPIGPRLQKPGN